MSQTTDTDRTHPVHRFTGRLHTVLDQLAQVSTWSLTDAELTQCVAELVSGIARQQGLLLTLLADADRNDLATGAGAVNTAAWLRALTRTSGPEATRLVKTARALESHAPTSAALAAGEVNLDQARVVLAAVQALPEEVADLGPEAESHLLGLAGEHDASALKALGRHLVEVVAPEVADEILDRQLQAEEERARQACHLWLVDDGAGSMHGRFKIPILPGLQLKAMLQAIANPTLPEPLSRDGKCSSEVLGEALCGLIDRYPVDRVPATGGSTATVVVTMGLETLEGRLQTAGILGTSHRLSAGQARRLACQAGVIPAVLGGKSQVLDLGRKRRLHSKAQRLAMAIGQHGVCAVEHCDRPTGWAEAHHLEPWSHGGHTNTQDSVLICPRDHTLIHAPHLTTTRLPTGKLRFHRRT